MALPGCEGGKRENEFPVPETTGNYFPRRGHDQNPTDSVPWTDMKRLLDFMQTKVVCTAVHNPQFKNQSKCQEQHNDKGGLKPENRKILAENVFEWGGRNQNSLNSNVFSSEQLYWKIMPFHSLRDVTTSSSKMENLNFRTARSGRQESTNYLTSSCVQSLFISCLGWSGIYIQNEAQNSNVISLQVQRGNIGRYAYGYHSNSRITYDPDTYLCYAKCVNHIAAKRNNKESIITCVYTSIGFSNKPTRSVGVYIKASKPTRFD